MRTVTVYDPETLRPVKVPADDVRAIDFLSKAEASKERRERTAKKKKVEDVIENAVERTLTSEVVRERASQAGSAARAGVSRAAAAARAAGAVGGGSAAAGIATLGVAGTAAAVGAAFAVGYAIGTAGIAAWKYLQPDEVQYRKALAFQKARKDWQEKYGRPPTTDEVKAMGKGFLDSFKRAGGVGR